MLFRLAVALILGALVGVMFKRYVHRERAKGPSSTTVKRQIYHDAGKCYRFTPRMTLCPPSVDVTVLEHSSDDTSD